MELNHQKPVAPPRPAATVVLLRDDPAGMQVFMIKRHGLSDVMGGAYVFPGGKVDRADSEDDALARLGVAPEALHRRLGDPALDPLAAAAFYMAACRETFEESGVLLTQGATPAQAQQATGWLREGHGFVEVLERLDARVDLAGLAAWSRWITPVVPSLSTKRFDTHFFVAALPQGQVARHDDHEGTDSAWLTPRAALDQYWAREINLAPPQIMSLAHLTRYRGVADVLADCATRPPPVIQPEPMAFEGTRLVAYPGDEAHPVRARALPGPTRLVYREGRFEPIDGYEALFR